MNNEPVYDIQKLRDRMDKEDNILFNRTGIFFTSNGLFLASAELSRFQSDMGPLLIRSIAILGAVLTFLWFLCSFQTYRVIRELQEKYKDRLENKKLNVDHLVFDNLFNWHFIRPVPIMAIFIPSILLIFWICYQILLYLPCT